VLDHSAQNILGAGPKTHTSLAVTKHGRSEKWIQPRMMGQETRNKLTDYWKDHDIRQEEEYAILPVVRVSPGKFECLRPFKYGL